MTLEQALRHASKAAKARRDWQYVVYECEEYDSCTDFDLDTYYNGNNNIIAVFGPDGQREE